MNAIEFHLARKASVSLVTVHVSGFNTGAKATGHGAAQNPFPPGIYANEWEAARRAGMDSQTALELNLGK